MSFAFWPKEFIDKKIAVYAETTSINIVTGEIFHFFPESRVWAQSEEDLSIGKTLAIQWTEFFHQNKAPYNKEYYKNPGYFINQYQATAYVQYSLLKALFVFDFEQFYGKLENVHLLGFDLGAFKNLGFEKRNPRDLTRVKYREYLRTKYLVSLKDGFLQSPSGNA